MRISGFGKWRIGFNLRDACRTETRVLDKETRVEFNRVRVEYVLRNPGNTNHPETVQYSRLILLKKSHTSTMWECVGHDSWGSTPFQSWLDTKVPPLVAPYFFYPILNFYSHVTINNTITSPETISYSRCGCCEASNTRRQALSRVIHDLSGLEPSRSTHVSCGQRRRRELNVCDVLE